MRSMASAPLVDLKCNACMMSMQGDAVHGLGVLGMGASFAWLQVVCMHAHHGQAPIIVPSMVGELPHAQLSAWWRD